MSIDTKKIGGMLLGIGIDPRKIIRTITSIPGYISNYYKLKDGVNDDGFRIKLFPILSDNTESSGVLRGHYFNQDLWAAKKIYKNKPDIHIDIGSRIDGFIAHLLVFMDVVVLDIRDNLDVVNGLIFKKYDIMNTDDNIRYKSKSVSSLHVIEHLGLGRYGDEISYDGWKTGLQNIANIVDNKGHLYISVPVGNQRIEYNAHRVFDPLVVYDVFVSMGFELLEYSYVDDNGYMHENVDMNDSKKCRYGCGCYELYKK